MVKYTKIAPTFAQATSNKQQATSNKQWSIYNTINSRLTIHLRSKIHDCPD